MSEAVTIPDKRYFKIGEVCELVDLKPHVLRYWESEFKLISPVKAKSNQRLYRRKDVEAIVLIKDLLYNQQYTIAGAKRKLKVEPSIPEKSKESTRQLSLDFNSADYKNMLQSVLQELKQLKKELDSSGV